MIFNSEIFTEFRMMWDKKSKNPKSKIISPFKIFTKISDNIYTLIKKKQLAI